MTHTTTTQRYKLDYPVRGELTDIDRKILAEIEQELNTISYEPLPEADVRSLHASLRRAAEINDEGGHPNTEGERELAQLMLDYAAPKPVQNVMFNCFQYAQIAAERRKR